MQGEQRGNSQELVVPVLIELHPSLEDVLDAQNALHKSFMQALMLKLTVVMDTLGIPGKPGIQIKSFPEQQPPGDRILRVSVNGRLCRYSDELLQRVYSYVNETQLTPSATPSFILAWLSEPSKEGSEQIEIKGECLVEFLSLACLEIIKRHPSALLGLPQVAVYSAALPNPTDSLKFQPDAWPPDPEWLLPVLSKLLQFYISLADMQTVARVLGRSKDRSQQDVFEDLVDVLRSSTIEIHLSREYLKQLSISASSFSQFVSLRNFLYQEFGLRYPEFRFVLVESSKPNSFTCKINNLTMMPWIGLQSNQRCIYAPVDFLQSLHIEARPAIDPIWGLEGRIIDINALDSVNAEGIIVVDPLQYIYYSLFVSLKEQNQCFVFCREVQDQLKLLESTYPALSKTIQASTSVEQITQVLRELVSEEISVAHLRFILERMLDYDYIFTAAAGYMTCEDQLPVQQQSGNAILDSPVNIASFIRVGLKRYISRNYANEQGELSAFNLMSLLNELLKTQGSSSIGENQLLEFLKSKIDALWPGTFPVLLSTIDLRPTIRTITASEFPRLPVLAFQELTSDLKLKDLT